MKSSVRRAARAIPGLGALFRDREALRQLRAELWQPPGHFYSPIPSLEEVGRREASIFGDRPMPGVDLNEAGQLALLERLAAVAGDHGFASEPAGSTRYFFGNPAFSAVDAVVWAAMIRTLTPSRVIEVGSGYSTAALMDTRERAQLAIDVTLIEPYPALVKSLLRAGDSVRMIATTLQDVPLGSFDYLQRGDVLFIDSTHVAKTGSDVNYAIFEILPRLASGVYIHIHDILDGFEYPREWVYQGRAWNEAYLVRAFLEYNTAFEIVLWPPWLARAHPDALRRAIPLPSADSDYSRAASLWLRKR